MMEEYNVNNRKRDRDESDGSDVSPPEPKLTRVDSDESNFDAAQSKFVGAESDYSSDVSSPEAWRIQDDLLNILDDSDTVNDPDPAIQGLDSVIKSFEEEIQFPPPAQLTPYSGESQPELGYLLEASDDELGLPPNFSTGDELGIGAVNSVTNEPGAVGLAEVLGFEADIPNYDSFDFGFSGESDSNNNSNYSADFVTLGGLFDYSDESYEPADMSDLSWQPESLSAL